MDSRRKDLAQVHSYIEGFDKEITMILQSLQWDRKHFLEAKTMVTCKYDAGHRVPLGKQQTHEKECFLKSQGYTKEDTLLPDPIDPDANTLVKLNKEEIKQIIMKATETDPSFKIGLGSSEQCEPLSVASLQAAYSADERRAIHDAVVRAVPSCHDLTDLALPSTSGAVPSGAPKSRMEVLAELRDLKRRRAKYRVPNKTRNYSDVLRELITTQMETFTETKIKVEPGLDFEHNQISHRRDARDTNLHEERSNTYNHNAVKREPSRDRHRDSYAERKRHDVTYRKYDRESRNRRERSSSRNRHVDRRSDEYSNSKQDRNKNEKSHFKQEKEEYFCSREKRRRYDDETSNERVRDKSRKRHNEDYETRSDKYEDRHSRDKRQAERYDYKDKHGRYNERKEKRTNSPDRYAYEKGCRYYDNVRIKEEPEDF